MIVIINFFIQEVKTMKRKGRVLCLILAMMMMAMFAMGSGESSSSSSSSSSGASRKTCIACDGLGEVQQYYTNDPDEKPHWERCALCRGKGYYYE